MSIPETTERWLTIDEAAEYLGVSRRAIHRYIKERSLPAYKSKVRGRTLLRQEDLDAFRQPRPLRE